jgi:hypothetical protein
MSNQDYRNNPNLPSSNPWSSETSQGPPPQQQYQDQQQQQYGDYAAPPGPPPGQQAGQHPGQQPGQLPRSDTFKESDFIPESERGEQREAMQQFEMNKSGSASQQDRDVEQLQREFPGVDGSLIAALYSDSGNMGATKEMLMELASSTQGGQ